MDIKYIVLMDGRFHGYSELPTAYNTPSGALIFDDVLCGSAITFNCGCPYLRGRNIGGNPQILLGYGATPQAFDLALIANELANCNTVEIEPITVEIEPITVNALNCDNTTTPIEVSQRVSVVSEQPLKVCIECCPQIQDGLICVNGTAICAHYALDAKSGEVVWVKGKDGTDYPITTIIKGCDDCPFASLTATIFQTGANSIDNVDSYFEITPDAGVTIDATDCFKLTLQFKDPITGANVGAAKTYTTNVGTNFTPADVLDWANSFGIFGGVQSWIGNVWSLVGFSKNEPQGAFLLPNAALAYDIEMTGQTQKDCNTQTTNVATVTVLSREIAIADNGTAFLTPAPYTSDTTPIFPLGGLRLVQPINHPMVVYAAQPACGGQQLIGLQGTAPGITIHNDGNWSLVFVEKKIGATMTVSIPLTAGIDFRTAIVDSIATAVSDTTVIPSTPNIGVDYPVLEYSNCTDGVSRVLAVNNTRPSDTVRVVGLQNSNGLYVELEFGIFKIR